MNIENIIKKQDKKYLKKYKPITTGLPKGFTKAQWFNKKHGKEINSPSQDYFFLISK